MENVTLSLPDQLTKENLAHLGETILSKALSGEKSAVKSYIELKAVVDTLSGVLKSTELFRAVRDELEVLPPNERKFSGVKMELRGTAAKWDFTANEKWTEIKEHLAQVQEQLKAHEAYLQAQYKANAKHLTVDGELIDEGQGAKLISPGGETVSVSFPKT